MLTTFGFPWVTVPVLSNITVVIYKKQIPRDDCDDCEDCEYCDNNKIGGNDVIN